MSDPVDHRLPTREPLTSRALVVAVVAVLGLFGVHLTDVFADQIVTALDLVALLLAPLVTAWWSRRHVTPVADPRADDGRALVAVPEGGVVHVEFPDGMPIPLDADTGPLDLTHGG